MTTLFDLDRIGHGLPFAAAVPEVESALASGALLVEAPPGTGKTTLVPPTVANRCSADGDTGTVLVTQPRRVAARASARRLAQLTGSAVGELAGFSVRGERRTSADTRVEFVTPGLLIRRLLADPELPGVAAVVLDEVHERSLDSDLLVGMLTDARTLRPDLALVAMSATLDTSGLAAVLSDEDGHATPVVTCPSVLHPLEIRWRPAPAPRTDTRGVTRPFLAHVAQETLQALRDSPGDALVFLPSVRDVEQVASELRSALDGVDVLELHGRLSASAQDHVTAGPSPGDRRRVIVSTALAESSLTVPGVRLVVDAGLSREPRRDAARGMSGLVTVPCSKASAEQRAGRAARLGPGVVVRCYDEHTFTRMPQHVTPEIATADLTPTALTLAAWGTPGGVGLKLPTPPPAPALDAAIRTLRRLDAMTDDGHLTRLGRTLAQLPVDPRLGRALLTGSVVTGAGRAVDVVAALSDDVRSSSADLATAIRDLSGPARSRWQTERRRLERLVAQHPTEPGPDVAAIRAAVTPDTGEGALVALAYPDRLAHRIDDGVYLLAAGTRAALPPGSPLRHHEWLAVADVARAEGRVAQGTGAVIRLGAATDRALAEACAPDLLSEEVRARWENGRVTARRVRALGAIELSSSPTSPTRAAARQAVHDALVRDGLGILPWSDTATALRNRLALLHRELGEPWPAVSDTALLERLDEWLAPELDALASGRSLAKLELTEPLRRLLPWPEAARFDALAPERLEVPSGSHIRVAYPAHDEPDAPPVVAVKLQECFGLTATPRLVDGRVGVVFHLLSPARHPVAITDDLASFWAGPYAGVRADMRGRYPKHPWPEDPSTHVATARTSRRL